MKIAAIMLAVAVYTTLTYSAIVNVPFGSSLTTIAPPSLLHRRDRVPDISNIPSTSHAQPIPLSNPFQVAAIKWDPQNTGDDVIWAKFKKKGKMFYCLMDMPDLVAGKKWPDPFRRTPPSAASPWKGTLRDELRLWGWFDASYPQDSNCNFGNDHPRGTNKIGDALNALGLSTTSMEEGGKNVGFSVEHWDERLEDQLGGVPPAEQFYNINSHVYRETGGYFRFTFNPEQGAIFGQDFLAPSAAASDNDDIGPLPSAELPRLRLASDILSAYWLRGPNPRSLKYWFGNDVTNDDTVPFVTRILVNHGHTAGVPYWPGLQIDVPSDEALVLLGSPIGTTVAFFLIQHKDELGMKHVTSITIFRNHVRSPEIPPSIQLLFRIEDVDRAHELPEDTEMWEQGGAVRKRGDSVVDLDLGLNVARLHRMSVDEWGVTVLRSHEYEREL